MRCRRAFCGTSRGRSPKIILSDELAGGSALRRWPIVSQHAAGTQYRQRRERCRPRAVRHRRRLPQMPRQRSYREMRKMSPELYCRVVLRCLVCLNVHRPPAGRRYRIRRATRDATRLCCHRRQHLPMFTPAATRFTSPKPAATVANRISSIHVRFAGRVA